MALIYKIWAFFLKLFEPKRPSHFSGVIILESANDAAKALKSNKLVVVGTAQKYKWLQFKCPCGCREIQAVSLMRSHHPFWTIEFHGDGTLTLNPSVDAKKCGAHFWVRRNEIVWC